MLKSYFLVALKHLAKQKLYTLINVIGLAVGLACFILIGLFVQHETSYDRQFANGDRIYRVSRDFLDTDVSKSAYLATAAGPIAPLLKEDFPGVEKVARMSLSCCTGTLRRPDGAVFFENDLATADPELLEIFDFEWLRGDPRNALERPMSIVLTASLARKYFGDDEPLGQTLIYEGQWPFEVTGVIADLGSATHFRFSALTSLSSTLTLFGPQFLENWGANMYYTYVSLAPGATAEPIRAGSGAFFEKRFAEGSSKYTRLEATALRDIHLRSRKENEMRPPGSAATVQTFVAVAVFILLLACINFMNLATARATQRAKEIGVRKAVGAERAQVIAQFLTESVLVAAMALVLALALVELVLPAFNALLGQSLEMRYLDDPGSLALLAGVTLVTGLLAGSYPAFYLAAFEPGKVLKGDVTRGGGAAMFRKCLVVLQFAISIALLIATAIVYEQTQFARNIDLGFDKDRVVIVGGSGRVGVGPQWEVLKQQWLANPEITQVTASALVPGMENTGAMPVRVEGHESDAVAGITALFIDEDFFETYGIGIVAGRALDESFADRALVRTVPGGPRPGSFVINESAAARWGWTPQEAVGKWLEVTLGGGQRGLIVGVVKDVYFESLRNVIEPAIYSLPPDGLPSPFAFLTYASLRVSGRDLPATLDYIDATWARFLPEQPVSRHFLDEDFEALYRSETRQAQMFTFFSALAVVIACMGLFGLASFTTERRTKEIGIRKTIGGSVTDIVLLISGEFGKLVLVANLVAWPVAYFLMQRWLASFAYRIDMSVWVFVASALVAFVIACVTVGSVAARAASMKPVSSLRYE
jgi:putative ABC transport system permease protein